MSEEKEIDRFFSVPDGVTFVKDGQGFVFKNGKMERKENDAVDNSSPQPPQVKPSPFKGKKE